MPTTNIEIGKRLERHYGQAEDRQSPQQEADGVRSAYMTESINQRTFYHPSSYQLQQVKAAAVAACQAATLNTIYKAPNQ